MTVPASPTNQSASRKATSLEDLQCLLRGVNKVSTEWALVCLAYNLRQLHTLDQTSNVVATA